ncbi:B3/B4 domain-containing protein [Fusobacterium sp. THCT1E2]
MKRFVIEEKVFEMFPHLEIGVLSFKDVDNSGIGKADMLENVCKSLYERLNSGDEAEGYIKEYSLAMKKFKTKKGAKASIDAMALRIVKGHILGSINPLVDIYNVICLKNLVTCGGEDMDKIEGDMVLCFAKGDEEFIPLGEEENKPPKEDELIYRDDKGAVVRGWLWREADRTKITENTKNALLYMELIDENRKDEFKKIVKELEELVLQELGGQCKSAIIDKNIPACEIG